MLRTNDNDVKCEEEDEKEKHLCRHLMKANEVVNALQGTVTGVTNTANADNLPKIMNIYLVSICIIVIGMYFY